MSGRLRVATVIGTRPEVIKLAPVVHELRRRHRRFESIVITTSQHRRLLDMALADVELRADYDLDLMRPRQRLADFAAVAITTVAETLRALCPDLLLVQGDTTTVLAASLAAFYLNVPVGHVEAGLRSFRRREPFPEEINRRIASVLADLHFAPTQLARRNLLAEGVRKSSITVTGNTVVDALRLVRRPSADSALQRLIAGAGRLLIATVHRRENHGAPLVGICEALREIVARHPDTRLLLPVHPNPAVQHTVRSLLGGVDRIHLTEPMSYAAFHSALTTAFLVLSDSGGVQEEAAAMHRPILILRDVTERPEIVTSGAGLLVGTEPVVIVRNANRLLTDRAAWEAMRQAPNPFGDGHAAERIVDVIESWAVARRGQGGRQDTAAAAG